MPVRRCSPARTCLPLTERSYWSPTHLVFGVFRSYFITQPHAGDISLANGSAHFHKDKPRNIDVTSNGSKMYKLLLIGLYSLVHFCETSYSDNDILRFNMAAPEPTIDPTSICKEYQELIPSQQSICSKYPHATASAMQGVQLSLHECKRQFSGHRWNCSNLDTTVANRHPILRFGYKETAFTHAIVAAGVLHQVATACALGKITSCSCDNNFVQGSDGQFQWNGCSHDLDFGAKYSRKFLQSREKDIKSLIHTHNSKIGRKAVIDQKSTKCKCHGMSSSCEIKTCWLAAPDFQMVGDRLKQLYDRAVQVDRTNSVEGKIVPQPSFDGGKKSDSPNLKTSIVYFEKSPTYCSDVMEIGASGTQGRLCNSTSSSTDNCSTLCCGRGYFTVKVRRVEKCNCKFHWCCYVICQKCEYDEWVTVCK